MYTSIFGLSRWCVFLFDLRNFRDVALLPQALCLTTTQAALTLTTHIWRNFLSLSSLEYYYNSNHISCSLGRIFCVSWQALAILMSTPVTCRAADHSFPHQFFICAICTHNFTSHYKSMLRHLSHATWALHPLRVFLKPSFFFSLSATVSRTLLIRREKQEKKTWMTKKSVSITSWLAKRHLVSSKWYTLSVRGKVLGSCLRSTWRAANLFSRAMSREW